MKIKEVRSKTHRKILDLRAVEAVILTPRFERLFEESDHEGQYEVSQYIQEARKEALKNWMACHPSLELGEYSHNKLKELGKVYSIQNWSRLTKIELITQIERWEEKYVQD